MPRLKVANRLTKAELVAKSMPAHANTIKAVWYLWKRTKKHLRFVLSVLFSSGALRVKYRYDSWHTIPTNGNRTKVHRECRIEYGEVSIAMENVFWHLDMGKSTDTLTLRTIVIKLVFICVHSVWTIYSISTGRRILSPVSKSLFMPYSISINLFFRILNASPW